MTGPEGERRWVLVAALALAAALVGSLWIVDYLPTGDGHNHALTGYLAAHLHDPGKGYDAFLLPVPARTNLAFHAPFAALVHVLPWRDALRVTLSIGALVSALGFASVATALGPRRAPLALVGFATALSWTFYMGLFSYWITVGLDLAFLGFALRRPVWSWRDRVAIGAALVLAMAGHAFAGMILGLALGVLVLFRASGWGRARELGALLLVSAPGLAIAALTSRGVGRVEGLGSEADPIGAVWLPARDRIDVLWQCFTGGPAWRGLVPLLAAVLAILGVMWRARRGRASRDEIAVASIAALMIVAVLATPIHVRAWNDLSPRFLPFGVSLGLALLPVGSIERPRARALAAAAIGAFALASIGWAGAHHARLSLATADAMTVAAEPLRREGPRLPIILAPPEGSVAQVDENEGIGNVFAIEQGGMTPYFFARLPGLHPFLWRRAFRDLFPRPPERFFGATVRASEGVPGQAPREALLAYAAMLGARYEDVILWGRPSDVDAFVDRGYVPDARRGGAAVMHFSPCGLSVVLDAGAPVTVEYGWAPLTEPAASLPIAERDAATRVGFPEAPCGPLWFRVFRDPARPAESLCRGADDAGRLVGRISRGRNVVRCRPPSG